jgi:hypothetical protein
MEREAFHELYRTYKEAALIRIRPSTGRGDRVLRLLHHSLAMKLKTLRSLWCLSDEYLNYAKNNRNEWERKGKEAIEDT